MNIKLENLIQKIVKELFFLEIPLEWQLPKEEKFGDISTNIALKISSLKKLEPYKVADLMIERLNKEIQRSLLKEDIQQIRNDSGFINFFFTPQYYYKKLRDILIYKDKFMRFKIKPKKVLIEFVSANPTGPLSVAHARQAVVGDVLANVLEDLGFKVKREYYINDEGARIDALGRSVEARFKGLEGKEEFPADGYLGEYIYDIAKEMKERKIQNNFANYAVRYLLKDIKNDLKNFGVRFDSWVSQKVLTKKRCIQKLISYFTKKGLIYEKEGAIWFKSTAFSDDKDRVIIKKDGSYTYLTADIIYHHYKYKRGFGWLINLWGPDHHGYIGRLKAAVEAMGKKAESLSIVIVQLVTLYKEGKVLPMSTRKAQYITLKEVLEEVGKDASRFFFIMRRTNSHLDFDLDLAKAKVNQNPVYYIQYAYARICGILRKTDIKIKPSKLKYSLLKEKEELELIKVLVEFPYQEFFVFKNLDPYNLTVYLQRLASAFHKFYDTQRVLNNIDKELSSCRIALVEATRIILDKGLRLLGISRPQSM
ncbi:MAG: arginine--tRNA ligase [Candidatus Omnitrophica bacterium]|nr:arginine--tRNA ligase [Candidatus Omnitrophota bacterium]